MYKLLGISTIICILMVMMVGGAYPVQAAASVFFGEDSGLGENIKLPSWPNANAAKADFLSNLSGVGTEDFEGFSYGETSPLACDFGAAGTATLQGDGYVDYVPDGVSNGVGRYPISGNQYWETTTDFYIEFSQPVAAFGFYGTDIGDFNGQVTIELVNGGSRNFTVNNTVNGPGGSVLFWGIIEDDPNLLFTRVNFGNTAAGEDYFGFDDFSIGSYEQVTGGGHPTGIGGEVQSISKFGMLFPIIGIAVAIIVGGSMFQIRHRKATNNS